MKSCGQCRHFQPAPKIGPGGYCYRRPPYNHQRFVTETVDDQQQTHVLWVPSRPWVDLVERACGEFKRRWPWSRQGKGPAHLGK